jgi:hypothetical protein
MPANNTVEISGQSLKLTTRERTQLIRAERTITNGLKSFWEVGLALKEIRDQRLYRQRYDTFEEYCAARWDLSRPRAYQLCAASDVVADLSTNVDTKRLPESEAQARPLSRLKHPEQRRRAWDFAVERAEHAGRAVTARDTEHAVNQFRAPTAPTSEGGAFGLVPNGGNDKVYSPRWLAKAIVAHFKPAGKILEPCKGNGAFTDLMPGCDWCEIDQGRDFLTSSPRKRYTWTVTNPPWSQFRAFLQKAMAVSDNVVFLSLVNAFFMKARLSDMKLAGFGFREFLMVPTPVAPWPQTGFQLGAVHIQRGYHGPVTMSEYRQPKNRNRHSGIKARIG